MLQDWAQLRRRSRALIVVLAAATVSTAGCGGGGHSATSASLRSGLISRADLPGHWSAFERSSSSPEPRLCGEGRSAGRAEPSDEAAVAWTQDPDDGPVLGERLERYDANGAEQVLVASKALELPCEWTEGGARWRMAAEPAIDVGDGGRVFLITTLDRPDSYNYEFAARSGDVLVLVSLNSRQPSRSLLDDLVRRAWEKGGRAGITKSN